MEGLANLPLFGPGSDGLETNGRPWAGTHSSMLLVGVAGEPRATAGATGARAA